MKKSDKLKQERKAILDAQNVIVQRAKTENREFTPEEQVDLTTKDGEVDALDAKIETAVADEKREARIASMAGAPVGGGEKREVEKMEKRFSISRALGQASKGVFDGVEKEINEIGMSEMRGLSNDDIEIKLNSLTLPSSMARASQSVTLDNGDKGGQLVGSEPRLVDGFIPKLFLEELGATFMTGLKGNVPLPVPGLFEFDWYDETEDITGADISIKGPVLSPKRAGAGGKISLQLINQSSVDAENLIWGLLRAGAGKCINKAAINGDGLKAPLGLLSMPGVLDSVLATVATDPELKHILELEGLIQAEDATEVSLGYLSNLKLLTALRGIKKDAGSGRFLMEDGKIDGSKTIGSTLVPALASNYPLIYGDWSQMFIGQWGGLNIVVDPYAGAQSGSVVTWLNMFMDVKVANPKAFARNKFLKA